MKDILPKGKRSIDAWVLGASVGVCLAGCGTPSIRHKAVVDSHVASGNYQQATDEIMKNKESEYGKSNAVLYYLDLAMTLHDARRYKESDAAFDKAEQRMEQLFTKSVTRHAGRHIVSDTTTEYPGQPHERALSHVFRALNYVYMDNNDEALVEIRKVHQFLRELRESRAHVTYQDDALAQYLGGMLYDVRAAH